MPRKPTLSPSKITTYLACPTKYRWTYIDPRGKWYLKSKSYFSFGTSLHNVLQRFHDSKDAGVTTTEEAIAALEESWIEAGYDSQDEMMQALSEGKSIIESYTERELTKPISAKTIFVEKLFRRDLGEFVLIGRVDRIDEHEDGSLEIIDYKSGRSKVDLEALKFDLAMSTYQFILKSHFPDRKISASIIAVRTGETGTVSLTETELQEFSNDIIKLGHEILESDWENTEKFLPVFKELCHNCDFLPLCKKDHDFSEAYQPANEE